MPVADLSQSAAKSRNGAAPPKKEEEIIEAEYAYIVYARKDDGRVVISPNVSLPLVADRAPTHDEIFMTSHVIIKDLVGQQYAAMAAQSNLTLNNFVAQQAQAMQNVDLANLHV